ncbi:reverse transcriptase domain-containing protein [Tanacetum coccineum]
MDDEPMWTTDRVVAPTPGSAITIPKPANEFAIKGNHLTLVKGNQFDGRTKTDPHKHIPEFLGICDLFKYRDTKNEDAKNQKTKSSLKKTVAFADEGNSNSNTDKIMTRIDVMTIKMDAQYKELQSRAKQPTPDLDDDDIPMSREEEAKFMQTFSVRINVPLVDVLAGMPNYGKFLKELISNKHRIEQIYAAFLSDESSAMIQNKVSPKLGDPGSFLIPCNFNKTFSCNSLADLGASINLMSYSLYTKLSLETLKPTKMSVRLADISFQYPVGIAENMLVEVGKFTFPSDFVILEMEEDSKVPLILGRPFLHTADAVTQVKQKRLNLGVRTERMIFNINSAIKYSYSNDDTCFSIDVINEILEEDFNALLNE